MQLIGCYQQKQKHFLAAAENDWNITKKKPKMATELHALPTILANV